MMEDIPNYMALGVFAPNNKRKRLNLLAICVNLFVPTMVFASLYAIMAFHVHYAYPTIAWCCIFIALFITLILGGISYVAMQQDRDPTWFKYATLSFFLATCLAVFMGDLNFRYFMEPYYDLLFLNTYPSVNVDREFGALFMDAGRVYFADGSRIDRKMSMAFKHVDTYCVAPIVSGNRKMQTYDFWAIGINCCTGIVDEFRCGEYSNPNARSGLRFMNPDQSTFLRLAVSQAEAAYSITANHPLFFHWVQDPVDELEKLSSTGYHFYNMGVLAHFCFNFFCVMVTTFLFSKWPTPINRSRGAPDLEYVCRSLTGS